MPFNVKFFFLRKLSTLHNKYPYCLRHAHYEFFVTEPPPLADKAAASPAIIGQVQVFDGDRGDRVELDLGGPDARAFAISPQGLISLTDPGQLLENRDAHFIVSAQDSGIPPRHAAVPVVVHFSPKGRAVFRVKFYIPTSLLQVVLVRF